MQARMKDGTYGLPQEYTQSGLEELMKNPKVEHVEVFNGTPEEIEKRKKKFHHKLSRGFKKASPNKKIKKK